MPKQRNYLNIFKFFVSLILVLFLINLFANILFYKSTQSSFFISPLAKRIVQQTITFINSRENSQSLEKIILSNLGEYSKNYGVVIFNLTTGERYYLNENTQFETASLYKLWVMAVAYSQLEKGLLNKEEILSGNLDEFNNNYSSTTDSAQLREFNTPMSVENALSNMITISDNYSAYLLIKKISINNVSNFLKENEFNNSRLGYSIAYPLSSAKDIALFFQKLYRGNLANKSYTDEMLNLLKQQKVNTKISNLLPDNVVVAHKTGELDNYSNDAGIIYSPNGDFIIVVMSNTSNPQTANNKIAQIAKEVNDYFSK